MQKLSITILLAAAAFSLNACNSTTTTAPSTTQKSASSTKPYPLSTCIVSDEPLESMGGSITKIHQGQEVKFCCKGCVKEFNASPEEFLSKLN